MSEAGPRPLPRTNPLKRMLCQSIAPLPSDRGCHALTGEELVLALDRAPELAQPGGALRLEGEGLPDRLLVVHGVDGRFYAYRNHCACGGFRVDPVPGAEKIRCCTLAQSTYDYSGRRLSGPAKKDLDALPVKQTAGTIRIDLRGVAETPPAYARKTP